MAQKLVRSVGLMLWLIATQGAAKEWQEVTVDDIQKNLTTTYDEWFGGDAPPLSDKEVDSMACLVSASSMGALITVVGGTAIVISGTVSTGTAIALPVLISSMWSACSLAKALLPGIIWLERRSKTLVNKISGAVINTPNAAVAPNPNAALSASDAQQGK